MPWLNTFMRIQDSNAQAMHQEINFASPGIYNIQVLGTVGEELWDYYDGKAVEVIDDVSGKLRTSLLVRVQDQAQLSGLIKLLYEWRLVLLSINIEETAQSESQKFEQL